MRKYIPLWKYLIEWMDLMTTKLQMSEIEEQVKPQVKRFWFVVYAP